MKKAESVVGKNFSSGMNKMANTLDGLPVVDAKKPLKISITDKDIKSSKSKAPDRCAAAIACLRETKATEVRVHLGRTYLRYNGNWVRYITPMRLQKEMVAFDRGGTFEPGEYSLLAPQPAKRLGAERRGGPKKKKHKKLSPTGYQFTANVREAVIHHK